MSTSVDACFCTRYKLAFMLLLPYSCIQGMLVLEARGVVHLPSDSWVTRFIKYCDEHIAEKKGEELIARVPRAQDQDRAGLTPFSGCQVFLPAQEAFAGQEAGSGG